MLWLYIIGGVIVVIVAVVLLIFYRGYSKVKPKPLPGIPCPPFSHSLFGHPDKMLSPLKHLLRLEVTESANSPYHQLVLFQHSSVFINDSEEAYRLFQKLPTKGPIYEVFRYSKGIPDQFASDGEAWALRSKQFKSCLNNIPFNTKSPEVIAIFKHFDAKLKSCSETGESLELLELLTSLSMDLLCHALFQYDLKACAGSQEGINLNRCLTVLSEHVAGQGIYANQKVRKYTPAEITDVTTDWRNFLSKLLKKARNDCKEYKINHGGELDVSNSYSHALIDLSEKQSKLGITKFPFEEKEMIAEIHQVFRHGHECIAGQLAWTFYALFRQPKIRARLETELIKSKSANNGGSCEYLDAVLKESFRKHPVTGNLTVRTHAGDSAMKLSRGHLLPVGTPVHFHMHSLHNTSKEWNKPHEFLPDRWLNNKTNKTTATDSSAAASATAASAEELKNSYPKCPFLASRQQSTISPLTPSAPTSLTTAVSNLTTTTTNGSTLSSTSTTATTAKDTLSNDIENLYEGAGFVDESLSYFPFSAGERSCPAKSFVLQILRHVVSHVTAGTGGSGTSGYRFEAYADVAGSENDPGASSNAIIIPLFKQSTNVRVNRMTEPGKIPKKKQEDGWAAEDDNIDNDTVTEVAEDEEDEVTPRLNVAH